MLVETRVHWLPKAGNSEDEYEDAFWPPTFSRSGRTVRCAIADGATETSFSRDWARLLVEAYGQARLSVRGWNEDLAFLGGVWRYNVGQKPLPWYAEEKLRQGAFAALLGLTLAAARDGSMRWSALAVGDCCLFQLRDRHLVTCFPISRSDEFNSRPYLIGSVRPWGMDAARPMRASGRSLPGDRFFLMSDALACWFLAAAEADACPWEEIDEAGAAFPNWVTGLRGTGAMRNDDVTLLAVDLTVPHGVHEPALEDVRAAASLHPGGPSGDGARHADETDGRVPVTSPRHHEEP